MQTTRGSSLQTSQGLHCNRSERLSVDQPSFRKVGIFALHLSRRRIELPDQPSFFPPALPIYLQNGQSSTLVTRFFSVTSNGDHWSCDEEWRYGLVTDVAKGGRDNGLVTESRQNQRFKQSLSLFSSSFIVRCFQQCF